MKTKFKEFMSELLFGIIILVISFGFLAVCNWDWNVGDWNGFSRVLFGFSGVIVTFRLIDIN